MCFAYDKVEYGIGLSGRGHAIKECFVIMPQRVVKLVTGLAKPADKLASAGGNPSRIRVVGRFRATTAASWNLC